MPYITKDRREVAMSGNPKNGGEMNYYVTMKCLEYLKSKGESYQTYLNIFSMLESMKMRIIRKNYIYPHFDEKPFLDASKFLIDLIQHGVSEEAVLATISLVEQELYRRRIGDYENGKIKSNGDVY